MLIVCDDKIPFLRGVFEPFAEVKYLTGSRITRDDIFDADALIVRTRTRCDRTLLEGTKVRVVASATIGIDHIDTLWCEQNGIIWANAPGCNARSVCQWVGSTLSALSHRLDMDLRGKTLGIVGVGHVGSEVARLAPTLGMDTLLCDPPRAESEGPEGFVSLEDITRGSDIITIHTPLTAQTFHLFDSERLKSLSSAQILINSARGEIVDGGALKSALRENRLRAAALDVWENEPGIDRELLERVTIATPHIAGYSADGKANGTTAAVRAVANALGIEALSGWKVESVPESADPYYDVLKDDTALRAHPEDFERLRSDYPIRREPLFKTY